MDLHNGFFLVEYCAVEIQSLVARAVYSLHMVSVTLMCVESFLVTNMAGQMPSIEALRKI